MAESVFGPGLGQAHEVGMALRRAGATAGGTQRIIEDPLHATIVASAINGDLTLPSVPLHRLVKRELGYLETICRVWAGVTPPTKEEVATILESVQEARTGILTPHDRIVPAGLDLLGIYEALYGFNRDREEGNKIKLYEEGNEWWRRQGVHGETTELAVFHTDFNHPFTTDLSHKPFGLTYDQQVAWARDVEGGDGITSVAETLYLYLRRAMEE